MNDSLRTTVVCHDPGEDSGDLIVDLSPDVLQRMNISLGDSLDLEVANEAIVLKTIRHADSES
ncbi:AbrB/MazE/SpoVT family DNA-binding domain-containing protein [Pseudomonas lini]